MRRMREMFRMWRLVRLIANAEDKLSEQQNSDRVYVSLILKDMQKMYGYSERTSTKIMHAVIAEGYVKVNHHISIAGEDLSTCTVTRSKGYRFVSGPSGFLNELAETYSGFTTILFSTLATTVILGVIGLVTGFFSWLLGLFLIK
jgi:hypothetical protein